MEDYDDKTIQMWLNADEWFEIGERVFVTLTPQNKYYPPSCKNMMGEVVEILPDKKYKVRHVIWGQEVEDIYDENQLSHCLLFKPILR